MKFAKELFKELGYILNELDDPKQFIRFTKQNRDDSDEVINFYIEDKQIIICNLRSDRFGLETASHFLSIQELQAINQQCKELGWLK